jgi:hypothetical protein
MLLMRMPVVIYLTSLLSAEMIPAIGLARVEVAIFLIDRSVFGVKLLGLTRVPNLQSQPSLVVSIGQTLIRLLSALAIGSALVQLSILRNFVSFECLVWVVRYTLVLTLFLPQVSRNVLQMPSEQTLRRRQRSCIGTVANPVVFSATAVVFSVSSAISLVWLLDLFLPKWWRPAKGS